MVAELNSDVMRDLQKVSKKAALTASPILITGECGTGKSLFAKNIYLESERTFSPFIVVDCADEKNATFDVQDCFNKNEGGTVFFDEIIALSEEQQKCVFQAISEKRNVKIIASTVQDVFDLVEKGIFSSELFYRLNILSIRIPPLRERKEDILTLADFFLKKYSLKMGKAFLRFSDSAKDALLAYKWQGNIRELENAVYCACIASDDDVIKKTDFAIFQSENVDEFSFSVEMANENLSLKDATEKFRNAYIAKVLEKCSQNKTKASKLLGIQRTYLSMLVRGEK